MKIKRLNTNSNFEDKKNYEIFQNKKVFLNDEFWVKEAILSKIQKDFWDIKINWELKKWRIKRRKTHSFETHPQFFLFEER